MTNFIFTLLLGSATLITGSVTQFPLLEENDDHRLRIIGGLSATDGEIPYQILLQDRGRSTCGGSFISVNGTHFVLTAAHCVPDVNDPSRYTVVAGEVDRRTNSGNEQTRKVTRIFRHDRFNTRSYVNDIALLVIDEPFKVNSYVSPIPLPNQGQKTSGEVVVSGWGRTSVFSRRLSPVLRQVYLSVIDDIPCRLLYASPNTWVYSSMLCAGKVTGGTGTCNGDSGGPLKAVNGDYLAAIGSWGAICAFPLQPGVYTEVSHYIDWIEQQAYKVSNLFGS
ncbi:unnamed protein product [Orchesella dallaii]|uniref:Peptidase S1 domain-containing protein n=1 Tax=Orchesella dallaii TaxID=48710 RepID=A0ABP1RV81_9HEXA